MLFLIIFSSLYPSSAYSEINVITTENTNISFSMFSKKLLLVDGMATWCSSCRIEMDYLKNVKNIMQEQLNLISLSLSPNSDTIEKLKNFKNEYSAEWIFALDVNSEFIDKFRPVNIPTMYLFDEEGILRKVWQGITTSSDIIKEINKYSKLDDSKLELIENGESDNLANSLIDDLIENNLFKFFSFIIIVLIIYTKFVLKPKKPSKTSQIN